jgi:hypothetical protein
VREVREVELVSNWWQVGRPGQWCDDVEQRSPSRQPRRVPTDDRLLERALIPASNAADDTIAAQSRREVAG